MWPMGSQENTAEQGANRWLTEELPRELEHREQVREAKGADNPTDQGPARLGQAGWLLLLCVLALIAAVVVLTVIHR